jgi:hypothetical protein
MSWTRSMDKIVANATVALSVVGIVFECRASERT